MTEPTQPGPYTGPPTPPIQPAAPAPGGWPAPPPQAAGHHPDAYPPSAPYGRPPGPPKGPAAVSERVSGALLLVGAALAVGASFATLDKSAEYAEGHSGDAVYRTVAKPWSYSNAIPGQKTVEVTQFYGVPLLIGGLVAIAAAVLLLAGSGRRLPPARVLGVTAAALLLGTTLTVATAAFNDTQWDTDTRSTTLGPGFYLLTLACLAALAATVLTVLTVLGTRRPAGPAPAPNQYPPQAQQPWQSAAAPRQHPPTQPPPPSQPPSVS
ncbi:hypothetical protein ACFWBB_01655 [Streptomyces sp. NPDC060000]|uniref:hypothetical protein n=1 Tax=Streptomyces sp. NPDC060000 TaxID=3347031 RepID=UPI0036843F98